VSLAHRRNRRRLALLAAGVLEEREREEALAHASACARCGEELAELRQLVAALESDEPRAAEPGVPVAVVVHRVRREVEAALVPKGRPRVWLVALPAAAALLAAVLLVPELVSRRRPAAPAATPETVGTSEALDRLERHLAREHAARYLAEAGDVLVAVAATAHDCERGADRLDVGEAPERSRELLARRAIVDADRQAIASARDVLDDVELALREVAELPACVRRRDIERVRREVDERQLLMRIQLLSRELEG
jgi:hypothetical protein